MTQRIFDIKNEKDYADLWNILPEDVTKIKRLGNISMVEYGDDVEHTSLIKINWHDKTEITRPVDYEDMIGCVGWFWDNDEDNRSLGVLSRCCNGDGFQFYYGNNPFKNFRPAKKSELKFWGE